MTTPANHPPDPGRAGETNDLDAAGDGSTPSPSRDQSPDPSAAPSAAPSAESPPGATPRTAFAARELPRLPDPSPAPEFPESRWSVGYGAVIIALGVLCASLAAWLVPSGLPTWVHLAAAFVVFLAADATTSVYRIGRIVQVRHWTPGVFAAAWVLAPGAWLLVPTLLASTVLNTVKIRPRGFGVVVAIARRAAVVGSSMLVAHLVTTSVVHSGFLTHSGPRSVDGRLALAAGGVIGGLAIAAVSDGVDRLMWGSGTTQLKPSLERQLLRASSVAAVGGVAAWVLTVDPWVLLLAVPVFASYLWHLKHTVASAYDAAWESELLTSRLVLDVSYPPEAVQAHATRRVLPYATRIQVTPRDTRNEAWQIHRGHLVLAEVDAAGTSVLNKVQSTTDDIVTSMSDEGLWVAINFGASAENLTHGSFITFCVPPEALNRKKHALDTAAAAVRVSGRLRRAVAPEENTVDPAIRLSAHRMLELLNRDIPNDRSNRREVLTELHRLELLVARHMGGRSEDPRSAEDSVGYVTAGQWTLPSATGPDRERP